MTPNLIHDLPLADILTKPQARTRFDEERLAGLTRSLLEVGLQQPIRVRPVGDKWDLIDGARRVLAARAAGWTTIPAVVESQPLTEMEVLQRQLICAVQTADLTDIEKARAIEQLIQANGWTAAQVAAKVGLSQGTVSRLRALLLLPAEVQDRIHLGKLATSTGYELAKTRNPAERTALLERAARGELTRDEAARSSRRSPGKSRERTPARRPTAAQQRIALMLGGRRAAVMQAENATLDSLIAWLEELLHRLRALGPTDMTVANVVAALNQQQE